MGNKTLLGVQYSLSNRETTDASNLLSILQDVLVVLRRGMFEFGPPTFLESFFFFDIFFFFCILSIPSPFFVAFIFPSLAGYNSKEGLRFCVVGFTWESW